MLFDHQKEAVDFILAQPLASGALFADMGCGKGLMALEIYSRLRVCTPHLRLAVVCPVSLIEGAWAPDIKKFTPYTYHNARKNGLPQEWGDIDIMIINYEQLILPKNDHFYRLIQQQMLVLDESSAIKAFDTKITRRLLALKHFPKHKLILSGTPTPNTPMEYWPQIEFISPGMLGKDFYAFRRRYFHLARGRQILQAGVGTKNSLIDAFRHGFKFEISDTKLTQLTSLISTVAFRKTKAECLSLPEEIDEVRYTEFSPKAKTAYKQMFQDNVAEISGGQISVTVALAKMMKLRELTSGFILDESGNAHLLDNNKLNALMEIVEQAGEQPLIIWAVFRSDIQRIAEALEKKYPGQTRTLYGETKDRDASINDFKSGAARFLIAHPQSAAHGLTFVNCSLMVFYSLDYSWENYVQARARIHRIGQTKKCTYIHLLTQGTVDEKVMKALKNKENMNELLDELLQGGIQWTRRTRRPTFQRVQP